MKNKPMKKYEFKPKRTYPGRTKGGRNMKDLIGKKCIVRGDRSGVYFGTIKAIKNGGKLVTLENVRNIWCWYGAASSLQLAKDGTSEPDECKFTVMLDEITITDVISIAECTAKAIASLESVKEWKK